MLISLEKYNLAAEMGGFWSFFWSLLKPGYIRWLFCHMRKRSAKYAKIPHPVPGVSLLPNTPLVALDGQRVTLHSLLPSGSEANQPLLLVFGSWT